MKCKNIECQKEFDKSHDMKISLGFIEIIQKQCPFCQIPIETEMLDINDED